MTYLYNVLSSFFILLSIFIISILEVSLFLAPLQETIVIAVIISNSSLILIPKSVNLTKIMNLQF